MEIFIPNFLACQLQQWWVQWRQNWANEASSASKLRGHPTGNGIFNFFARKHDFSCHCANVGVQKFCGKAHKLFASPLGWLVGEVTIFAPKLNQSGALFYSNYKKTHYTFSTLSLDQMYQKIESQVKLESEVEIYYQITNGDIIYQKSLI